MRNTNSGKKAAGGGPLVQLLAGTVLGATLLTGCEVTNPGPVRDEFLTQPESRQGLVNGAARQLAEAVSWMAYTTALPAQEIFPGGQTGAHGHSVLTQAGYFPPGSYNGYFSDAQQARYIAEEAIRRYSEVNASDEILFQAYNWAGYAYRTLGENWCQAVLDGGPAQPGSIYFESAVDNFNQAIAIAPTDADRLAATAGLASALAWLGRWSEAAEAAITVPDDFVFWLNLDRTEQDYENHIFFAGANQPYRAFTIWQTFYEDYYTATGDPRTPWVADPEEPVANAALSGYGPVPWLNQTKYTSRNDDMRLASGWEMRLIQAEALLEEGLWNEAMTLINHVRTRNISDTTNDPLEARQADNPVEAWTWLKRERGIELWLEGRRMGDLRRWQENDTPGALNLPNWEDISHIFTQYPRSLCFDIPDSEREANPNIPPAG